MTTSLGCAAWRRTWQCRYLTLALALALAGLALALTTTLAPTLTAAHPDPNPMQEGADVNVPDELGSTALQEATAAGNVMLTRLLLKSGARTDDAAAATAPVHTAAINSLVRRGWLRCG